MWSLNTYPLDCKLPAHSVCEDLELLFHSAYPLSNASVRNAEKCHRLQHMLGSQLQRRPQLQRRSAGTGPFFWQAPTLDVQMTVEKIWISPFIYSTLQWPGVCRTRRQRANFMTFSMIVYHIPSHMVGGTFYDIQLLSHSAAAEFCGVKIPTNRGMLEEGRGHIQGDSPILAPEKPIALGIGDPPPPLLGKFPTYSRFSSRQVACKIGWEP